MNLESTPVPTEKGGILFTLRNERDICDRKKGNKTIALEFIQQSKGRPRLHARASKHRQGKPYTKTNVF